MKMIATKERQSAPAMRRARPYVHHPMGPVQQAQQAGIRRILRSTGTQARLTIGQPNDKYEQEADRVADQVMAIPTSKLQRQPENEEEEETLQSKPLAEQIMPLVQRQEEPPEEAEEEEEEPVQAKSKAGEVPTVTPSLEARINSLKGGGQSLDSSTRAFFEPRFGHDFSHVRVHTESSAADTAKSINARAFTLGNHVVMGSSEYHPNSQSGQRLLGHELTHVIQQGEGRPSSKAQHRESIDSDSIDVSSRVKGNQYQQKIVASLKRDGNDLATPVIQRAPPGAKAKKPKRKDYIFIMGQDPWRCRKRRGRKRCWRVTGVYAFAARYFRSKAPGAFLIFNQQSLFDVLSYVSLLKQPVGNLYLVSHANKEGTLSFPISGAYKKGSQTTFRELKNALALPQVSRKIIDKHTTIHIKGCDIGRSKRMLDLIDEKFGGKGTVVAPTHRQGYGPKSGRGTPYEGFLGYFVERRGAVRLRRAGLLAAFRQKYPHLAARRLRKFLRKVKRRVLSHTAYKKNIFRPTKKQATWLSRRRRFFPPYGYVKIGGKLYRVDGLKSYGKKTTGSKFINYVYTYWATRKKMRDELRPITVKVPTKKKVKSDANHWANNNLARPKMYAWKFRAKRKRSMVFIRVIGRMTEYRIDKDFTMPRNAKKAIYYGRSTYTAKGWKP